MFGPRERADAGYLAIIITYHPGYGRVFCVETNRS